MRCIAGLSARPRFLLHCPPLSSSLAAQLYSRALCADCQPPPHRSQFKAAYWGHGSCVRRRACTSCRVCWSPISSISPVRFSPPPAMACSFTSGTAGRWLVVRPDVAKQCNQAPSPHKEVTGMSYSVHPRIPCIPCIPCMPMQPMFRPSTGHDAVWHAGRWACITHWHGGTATAAAQPGFFLLRPATSIAAVCLASGPLACLVYHTPLDCGRACPSPREVPWERRGRRMKRRACQTSCL